MVSIQWADGLRRKTWVTPIQRFSEASCRLPAANCGRISGNVEYEVVYRCEELEDYFALMLAGKVRTRTYKSKTQVHTTNLGHPPCCLDLRMGEKFLARLTGV
jgi:hypothetical protein